MLRKCAMLFHKELREACEMAGFRYLTTPSPHWYHDEVNRRYRPDEPSLIPYVASELVEKIRENGGELPTVFLLHLFNDLSNPELIDAITPEHIIRTAIIFLKQE